MTAIRTLDALNAAWETNEPSPADNGAVEMIVRRPRANERESLDQAQFTAEHGLSGDDWLTRAGEKPSGINADTQVTLMNSRVIQLLTDDKARWAESGDQLFVDLELSQENLPPGTKLHIGGAIMEITRIPHTGCGKFARRFGAPARKWVMTDDGKRQRLRGVYARVIQDGVIRVGDRIIKASA